VIWRNPAANPRARRSEETSDAQTFLVAPAGCRICDEYHADRARRDPRKLRLYANFRDDDATKRVFRTTADQSHL
jgi:hypothetical protein